MGEPSSERVSLSDFAKVTPARKPGMPCWACSIKEAGEINEARRNGTTLPVIRKWLIEVCGYGSDVVTQNRLNHHFSNDRHHER